eukprot:14903612-Alexandrium_andersonii.AAC.1
MGSSSPSSSSSSMGDGAGGSPGKTPASGDTSITSATSIPASPSPGAGRRHMGHAGSMGRAASRSAPRQWGWRRCPQPAGHGTHSASSSHRQTGQGSLSRRGCTLAAPATRARG